MALSGCSLNVIVIVFVFVFVFVLDVVFFWSCHIFSSLSANLSKVTSVHLSDRVTY